MCTKPLIGYPCGYTDKGKIKYIPIPYSISRWEHLNDHTVSDDKNMNLYGKPILMPCGKCDECRMNYAKKWADRCMLELQDHNSAYFLTLTYDDKYLPIRFNEEGFEDLRLGMLSAPWPKNGTLFKRDFQLFMKRLRKMCEPKEIRFYMCGEYGSHTKRPHYHAIIFGLELNDLEFYSKTELGDILYNSKSIQDKWPYGHVVIGDVTPQSCAYVARYVMKKQGYDKEFYEKVNIAKEYTDMSRRPGIGKNQYSPEIFRKGYTCISTENGGINIYPPKYYEKFFEEEFPGELADIKAKRIESMRNTDISKKLRTSKHLSETYDDKDYVMKQKAHTLLRTL